MALTQEDLQALGSFIDSRISEQLGRHDEDKAEAANTPEARTAVVGKPDVDPEAGPTYWVHLANGDTVETKDSGSTHLDVNGVPVLVIGRYAQGE